jgi:CheY-like chemotaxis protein
MAPAQRVLYVEDEPDLREIARIALAEIGGFEVTLCADGGEAVDAADISAPDIILLDVVMPGIDGREAFRRLRDRPGLAHTPIVFVTGRGNDEDLETFRQLGAAGVITKPFDPIALPAKVRAFLDVAIPGDA